MGRNIFATTLEIGFALCLIVIAWIIVAPFLGEVFAAILSALNEAKFIGMFLILIGIVFAGVIMLFFVKV